MPTKSSRLTIHMTPAAKKLLEQAAALRQKTVGEFVIDHSLIAAEQILVDLRK